MKIKNYLIIGVYRLKADKQAIFRSDTARRLVMMCILLLFIPACQGQLSMLWPQKLSADKGGKHPESSARKVSEPSVKIALLVPLSGKYAPIGQQLLDAAQLALFHFNNPNMELIPIDTKETVAGAEAATQKAISQSVSLIIGPLFSDATRAVAPMAQRAGIQLISFSNDKNLQGTGAFVMGFRLEQHAMRVIEYAKDHRAIHNMTAIVPEGSYGVSMIKILSEYLPGGAIYLGQQADAAAWAADINAGYGLIMTQPDNSALFIAEGELPLKKITEALAATPFQKKPILLLGTASWYDDAVLTIPAMEGAMFAALPRQQQAYFEQQLFMGTYHYQPRNITSLAYDAVALAATLAKNNHGEPFARAMFINPAGFSGVNGIFRFGENGLVERGLAVMRIQDGKFVTVEPVPARFQMRR